MMLCGGRRPVACCGGVAGAARGAAAAGGVAPGSSPPQVLQKLASARFFVPQNWQATIPAPSPRRLAPVSRPLAPDALVPFAVPARTTPLARARLHIRRADYRIG